ncbi:MAG: NAD-dependent epimerase/dehydratase family protein [Planctomycetota bacterium]|jgi:nucleoside-diphosphate-sugar epimerase
MRVALTGVSGFIGSCVARRLAEHGHRVTGLVRPASRRDHVEAVVDRFVEGAQEDDRAWPALLDGADAVVHNSADWGVFKTPVDLDRHLASNVVGSIRLLHAAIPRRFVFMSTIAVHHDMRPRWAGRIDEDHPLRPGMLYGAYKAAVEDHLWAAHATHGVGFCALRPCAVYGIDPKPERSIGQPIIASIRAGRPFTRAGGGKFVHVEDVAAVAVAALETPEPPNTAVNLADCYVRWADWAQMAADLLGVKAEIDFSSPPAAKNEFTKDAAAALGVPLDRGHAGIRTHLETLIAAGDRA